MSDAALPPPAPVPVWKPERPRLRPLHLLAAWVASAVALVAATWVVPEADIGGFGGALVVVALIAVLNAMLPPLVARLRVPFTVAIGFLLVLVLDGVMLLLVAGMDPEPLRLGGLLPAMAVALVASAVGAAIGAVVGIDEDGYTLQVARRVARRDARGAATEAPGILFLEIDGLALPVLRRALRDGVTPTMARWLASGDHRLIEWETDLSSQTGASQAGILLGSNADIPAFRWVDKRSGKVIACSNPDDCAAIERRHSGAGLLADGGTSRGNLLSGGADAAILTVSRLGAERSANPGYRAFLANGRHVSRVLVLALWEICLELVAAARQRRRDVRPRGHRGGTYPLLRAGMCVFVRDLVVFSILQDMFRGTPALYATFAGYDEVAHHSGLERADTLEALRKIDQRFALIERACRHTPRPYEIVVLSDHGQTQGATFRQRNGHGLDELVERSLERGRADPVEAGDENETGVGRALNEAIGRQQRSARRERQDVGDRDAIVLGSGNLGLIYLMESADRLTFEEIRARHPRLIPALCDHPHIGFVLVRSAAEGPLAIGAGGTHRLADGTVTGDDPLAGFSPNAARHLRRSDGFAPAPDILVNSFYDPVTEEGCAFEELISFHGGIGGAQTQPFILHPRHLPAPEDPIVGAEAVHRLLRGWRSLCNDGPEHAAPAAASASSAGHGAARVADTPSA